MLLTTFLGDPPPKLVLIQDTIETKQNCLIETIVKLNHQRKTQLFSYENQIKAVQNLEVHDLNCLENDLKILDSKIGDDSICIFDSISDLLYLHGISPTLRFLRSILDKTRQTIVVLHLDLFEDDQVALMLQHMSNLIVDLHSKDAVEYIYKRVNGKASKHNEEIRIENQIFSTVPIKIAEKKVELAPTILPDQLTSFKISLNENEIESRKKLILPFMKVQENQGKPKVSLNDEKKLVEPPQSRVLYIPDDNDDIDEEDPDDDLDI